MKAVYIMEHGGPEKLISGELPDPVPEANEVLVRVRACGLNHPDLWVRKGLPFWLMCSQCAVTSSQGTADESDGA
jgi:NADPH:quinone reductase-like Zn-dependent oxidoreductase